jgi:hypothetical protein
VLSWSRCARRPTTNRNLATAAAVEIYEQSLSAMMASKPDPFGDLMEANKVSMMYYYMTGVYRRAGEAGKAADMNERRLALWRHWEEKLPNNSFIERQLKMRSE